MNGDIIYQVLQAAVDMGVREIVFCAGSRNSGFLEALSLEERLTVYYWPEERSGAFFALGRSRLTNRPVAVITTSGTAAAETLPATIEAYYSGVPLMLITADRPASFRGSGAPQSIEQMGLFSHYVSPALDVSDSVACDLSGWSRRGPVQVNVCLDEPQKQPKHQASRLVIDKELEKPLTVDLLQVRKELDRFFDRVQCPIAIVSTLKTDVSEEVAALLLRLGIPVLLEGISNLREHPGLQHLRIRRADRTDDIFKTALEAGYCIDGVLRIGGVPTSRLWRDLEYLEGKIAICGLSEQPFSGLSWNRQVVCAPLKPLLQGYSPSKTFDSASAKRWLDQETQFEECLQELFEEEPQAEPSLFYFLSKLIPDGDHVYLGNSSPIREWDMAAVRQGKWVVAANRGANGIDGQISTFLGLCHPSQGNWGIFGDLTALYDMAGCWILPQMDVDSLKIIVVNNSGGKFFERIYPNKENMLNRHRLNFRPLAEMWGLDYACWKAIPTMRIDGGPQFIEIIPDEAATARFWEKYPQAAALGQRA